jgi:serine/threonine protein kinase
MAKNQLPEKDLFYGVKISQVEVVLDKEIGRGNIGVVYHGKHQISEDSYDEVAVKIIPEEDLIGGWDIELKKVIKLAGIPEVIQYKYPHKIEEIKGKKYLCIFWEYINGISLREYTKKNPEAITISFIETLLVDILRVFFSMQQVKIFHGDLHSGNIMIAYDKRRIETVTRNKPIIKVGDFGIGGSYNKLEPKDDYVQLAQICHDLLYASIDPAKLNDPGDKYYYKFIVEDFLNKNVLENDPTIGEFVRNPEKLLEILLKTRNDCDGKIWEQNRLPLKSPFDYLSCEQIGDSFDILQTLYSTNFPGYQDILEKTNTLLTGPRGCGKTTIFRNLCLKTQLLSSRTKLDKIPEYVGIYYHCRNLFFIFRYYFNRLPSVENRRYLIHYFNLALLRELVDTSILATKHFGNPKMDREGFEKVEQFIKRKIPEYVISPQGTDIPRYLLSFIDHEKDNILQRLATGKQKRIISTVDINFIPEFCQLLQEVIPCFKGRPIYFFLDDFSMPHVSEYMQETLNDIISYRWSSCFFKISTESTTTFNPYDSSGKLIEETREYDVIDFGSYFLNASIEKKSEFLVELINNRLRNTGGIDSSYHNIKRILGSSRYDSYNTLAKEIREGKHVEYGGIDTIVDLFSGDIADMLRLIRNIFSHPDIPPNAFSKPGFELPLKLTVQNSIIRTYGANFLNRIEGAPKTGANLRKVVQAFGQCANWYLKNKNSKNIDQRPPWQAFRIEIRGEFSFQDRILMKGMYDKLIPQMYPKAVFGEMVKYPTVDEFTKNIRSIYHDLLRYGVFLRDVRGKSVRGSVVPRLYMRRLLIPTFLLTPSTRDSISLEVIDFFTLLVLPDNLIDIIKKRKEEEDDREQTTL